MNRTGGLVGRMDRIGLIAGKGMYPVLICENLKKNSDTVYTAAFYNETAPVLKKLSDNIKWFKIGELGSVIEYFRTNQIKKIIMAGLIKHTKIFENIYLDNTLKNILMSLKDKKADSILGAIADEFVKNGMEIIPVLEILKNNIVKEEIITNKIPNSKYLEYINFGFRIAKEISKLDIGQTIVIKEKAIVAVEAMEGTDRCILRGGDIAGDDCIIIKVAKFNQDLRFDLPVIGPGTIKKMNKIKSKFLAVEAYKTIIIDRKETIDKANKSGISIIGLKQ